MSVLSETKTELNPGQFKALKTLEGRGNVFLTGAAGSGKSFLLRHFLQEKERKSFPVLASTGAAAILVGGRTFHSFFGLGILEGGEEQTIHRAATNKRVASRLSKVTGVVIDEVSMLSGKVLRVAEQVARKVRGNDEPWGGMRVIAVGDFAQLPPVNPYGTEKEWAFLDPVWEVSQFSPIFLSQMMRSSNPLFIEVLNQLRVGELNSEGRVFLNERTQAVPKDFVGTRLFSRRDDVEKYNLSRLEEIQAEEHSFTTIYSGKESEIEKFKKNAPIPDVISLKEGALVMLRQNDPEGKWVNGSAGHLVEISDSELTIQLLSGREVEVKPVEFTLLDAEGEPVVVARNFPVNLAWAMTIHKAQGATLDKMSVDMRRLWEPGQAYVAVSRVRDPENLYIEGWNPTSIKTDPAVVRFHRDLHLSES